MPHSTLEMVNPLTTVSRSRFRPMKLASHPLMGRITALAIRYEVNTQVASSTLADMLPAMCGRLTFTTEVSSTSMMALDMTAIAISQRFAGGPPGSGGLIS